VDVKLHTFQISEIDRDELVNITLRSLYPQEFNADATCIGDGVVPVDTLDVVAKRIFCPSGTRTPVTRLIVCRFSDYAIPVPITGMHSSSIPLF